MKNLQSSLLSSLVLAGFLSMPAFAKDGNEVLQDAALLPARSLSLASGLTVGTAIAIVRKTTANSAAVTTTLVGDSKDFAPAWIAASMIGVPVGVVTGTIEGTYIGVKNALTSFGSDNPLSPESISLGKLD
jgi:hypothetical protein